MITWIIFSCGNPTGQETHQREGGTQEDLIVHIEDTLILPRLRLDTIRSRPYVEELTVTGVVKTIPAAYAEIGLPYAGRIMASKIVLGQKINKGSPLLEISSPDYYSAQKEYFHAKHEFDQGKLKLKRQYDLYEQGVGVQRELEDAETECKLKRTTLEHALAALKFFNADPEHMSLGELLSVTSPITGVIITDNIVIGQYLTADEEPVATVADLSSVWVAGQVKEKDLGFLNDLDEVEIRVPAFPTEMFKGTLHHLSDIIDAETRSAEILVQCDNPNGVLKPGMYVSTRLKGKPQEAFFVATTSVFQNGANQFVFTKLDSVTFEKRVIKTAGERHGRLLVTAGLDKGEVVVAKGGSLLNTNY
ncbi:MAG: efflux RND transporter periplasmic adaptor subunit [Sphingobacterium sp.]